MRLFAQILCLEGYDDLAVEATEALQRLIIKLGDIDHINIDEDVYNNIVESTENETMDKSKCSRCKSSEFIEDYTNGIVTLNNFETMYYSEYISIYMNPATKDIIVNQDKILEIDVADVTVNVIPTQK